MADAGFPRWEGKQGEFLERWLHYKVNNHSHGAVIYYLYFVCILDFAAPFLSFFSIFVYILLKFHNKVYRVKQKSRKGRETGNTQIWFFWP